MRVCSSPRVPVAVLLVGLLATAFTLSGATPSWVCWGPGLPDPCRNELMAVAEVPGSGGGDLWAAGRAGTLLHWNGSSWQAAERVASGHLFGIAMVSSARGWAVGADGLILEYNGASWYVQQALNDAWVRTVEVVPGANPPQAWAPADKYGVGSFLYYNGSRWESKYQGVSQAFGGSVYGVAMVAADDGWAVGTRLSSSGSLKGQVLRWAGSRWEHALEVDEELFAVDLAASGDGWAVGEAGAVYRLQGGAWSRVEPVTDRTLRGVATGAGGKVWAVGDDGALVHFDGAAWSVLASPTGSVDLQAVALTSADEGWAMGEGGALARLANGAWGAAAAPPGGRLESIAGVPGAGGADLWAVGADRNLQHYNGRRWTAAPGPTSSYYAVAMAGRDDGWAAGPGGRFARWDGATWQESARVESAQAIVMQGPNDGWAVGWGKIQHWDGSAWTLAPSPTTRTLYGADAADGTTVWAAGDGGTILRCDGGVWSQVASPVSGWLTDVGLSSPNLGYIVGSSGVILEWRGSSWRSVDHGQPAVTLRGVDLAGTGGSVAGWIVGDGGLTLKLSGGGWRAEPSPTSVDLFDVITISLTDAWAVGDHGVLMHWTDQPEPAPPEGLLVAAAAKLSGAANTDWRTDLVVTNLGTASTEVEVEAWLRDQANLDPVVGRMVLGPWASAVREDVLGSLLGLPSGSAAALVVRSEEDLALSSRTYNRTTAGTYGQSIPAVALDEVFAAGQTALLVGLVESSSFRSNLGIVNTTGETITVEASFRGVGGIELGTVAYTVPAQGTIQRTRVLRDVTSSPVDLAWVSLHATSGEFAAFLSTVDAATGDPVYHPALAAPSTAATVVLQGIAKVRGAAGTNWMSSLTLLNRGLRPATVTLDLHLRGSGGGAPAATTSIGLQAGEIRGVEDVLLSLFGLESGAGSLVVQTPAGVLVDGRTFNQAASGSYGQYIPAQGEAAAISGSADAVFVGVVQSQRFRSNLGLTNPSTVEVQLDLELLDRDGDRLGGVVPITLAGGAVVQLDRVAERFVAAEVEGATLVLRAVRGAGAQAFLSVVDNRTGDPVFQVPTRR